MRIGALVSPTFGAVACVALLSACGEEPEEIVETVRAIKTVTVAERAGGKQRSLPGVVQAVDTAILSFQVAGNTRTVDIDVGQRFAEGAMLASLDPRPFEIEVEAGQARVGRAKAQLAKHTTEFERQKTLFENGWVTEVRLDQAQAAFDSARNQLSYAQAQLNLARRDLDKTLLTAPFDGVVARRHVDPFQEVARGEPVFDIHAEGAVEVVVNVPEGSINQIYLGLPAVVGYASLPAVSTAGRVSEVGTQASEANTFPVKVALLEPPSKVLPGMSAEVTIILDEGPDATGFLVPLSAVQAGGEKGRGYVFRYDSASSTVERVAVQGGGVRDDKVLVSGGVAAGDVIAVAGVSFLRDGQPVTLLAR